MAEFYLYADLIQVTPFICAHKRSVKGIERVGDNYVLYTTDGEAHPIQQKYVQQAQQKGVPLLCPTQTTRRQTIM